MNKKNKKSNQKASAKNERMEKIISLAKRRGFIFPSSEIYGGLNSCYDYGPLGVELKNNIKKAWWREMVQLRKDVVGLDSAILMHPKIWEASGHLAGFHDFLVDCKECRKRFRADHLLQAKNIEPEFRQLDSEIKKNKIKCPECGGDLTDAREFNLMFKTFMGAVEDETAKIYLRPETAQGIYVNFLNVINSTSKKLPFGIAQIGKAFRNEITPGNFVFRMREFEQMEMQFFINPNKSDKWFKYWQGERWDWYLRMGLKKENLNLRPHAQDELAHYAKAAVDIEYNFPFADSELEGIHNRGDFDLTQHEKYSKYEQKTIEDGKDKVTPFIIETSGGVDRSFLAFLLDAYEEVDPRSGDDKSKHDKEIVLRLHQDLSPIKVTVLPLSKKPDLEKLATKIFDELKVYYMCAYDVTGGIGKRYRRQDEIGTPYCLTVDFESLKDNQVTIRDRDTMKQDRVPVSDLRGYFLNKYGY